MAGHPHDGNKDDRVFDGDPIQTCEGWRRDRRSDMRCAYDAETDFLKTCDCLTMAMRGLRDANTTQAMACIKAVMERLRKKW